MVDMTYFTDGSQSALERFLWDKPALVWVFLLPGILGVLLFILNGAFQVGICSFFAWLLCKLHHPEEVSYRTKAYEWTEAEMDKAEKDPINDS
jgi:ABC-type sugar transport system permease subunit